MARSVTSTSIAKAVSWNEWQTSGKGNFLPYPALLLLIPKMKNPCLLPYMEAQYTVMPALQVLRLWSSGMR